MKNHSPAITQWKGKSPALYFVALSQIPLLKSKSTHQIAVRRKDKKQRAKYENNLHVTMFSLTFHT